MLGDAKSSPRLSQTKIVFFLCCSKSRDRTLQGCPAAPGKDWNGLMCFLKDWPLNDNNSIWTGHFTLSRCCMHEASLFVCEVCQCYEVYKMLFPFFPKCLLHASMLKRHRKCETKHQPSTVKFLQGFPTAARFFYLANLAAQRLRTRDHASGLWSKLW